MQPEPCACRVSTPKRGNAVEATISSLPSSLKVLSFPAVTWTLLHPAATSWSSHLMSVLCFGTNAVCAAYAAASAALFPGCITSRCSQFLPNILGGMDALQPTGSTSPIANQAADGLSCVSSCVAFCGTKNFWSRVSYLQITQF